MPRKKLSRQAKKSRVTLYEKSKKVESPSIKKEKSPSPVHHLFSEPATSSPGPSPATLDSSSPGLSAMTTCSPSLHDLTVTYDYSTDHAPLSSDAPSTDRFLALFPFTESPTTHRHSTGKGARLWNDLSPPINVKHHKQHKDQSSEIHQLNVIARKLKETLAEHQTTTQESMTFNSLPAPLDFSERESNDASDNCNHGDVDSDPDDGGEGCKDSEEDWFWSQVALQVDATTTHSSPSCVPASHTGTASTLSHTTQPTAHTGTASTLSHTTQPTAHTGTASTLSHTTQPTVHTGTASTLSHPISVKYRGRGEAERSVRRQLHRPPPLTPTGRCDDWGPSCDDEFVDQLPTQGAELIPPALRLGQSARQGGVVRQPAVASGGKSRPKCSQEEIEQKRVLAMQKLQAKLNRH